MSWFSTFTTPFSWMAAHITKTAIIKAMYGRTWRPWGARQVMREWFIFALMLFVFAFLVVVVVSVVVVLEASGIVAGLLVFSVNSILTSSGSFCLVFFDVVPSVVCSQIKQNVLKVESYFSSPLIHGNIFSHDNAKIYLWSKYHRYTQNTVDQCWTDQQLNLNMILDRLSFQNSILLVVKAGWCYPYN